LITGNLKINFNFNCSKPKLKKRGYTPKKVVEFQITNAQRSDANKKAIWIDAGIHGREWIAPAVALYFINQVKPKRTVYTSTPFREPEETP